MSHAVGYGARDKKKRRKSGELSGEISKKKRPLIDIKTAAFFQYGTPVAALRPIPTGPGTEGMEYELKLIIADKRKILAKLARLGAEDPGQRKETDIFIRSAQKD